MGVKEATGYPSVLVSLFCQSIVLEYLLFLHLSLSDKASSFHVSGFGDPSHVYVEKLCLNYYYHYGKWLGGLSERKTGNRTTI